MFVRAYDLQNVSFYMRTLYLSQKKKKEQGLQQTLKRTIPSDLIHYTCNSKDLILELR